MSGTKTTSQNVQLNISSSYSLLFRCQSTQSILTRHTRSQRLISSPNVKPIYLSLKIHPLPLIGIPQTPPRSTSVRVVSQVTSQREMVAMHYVSQLQPRVAHGLTARNLVLTREHLTQAWEGKDMTIWMGFQRML